MLLSLDIQPDFFTNVVKVAPLFTNAFVYVIMSRMIWNHIPAAKIWNVSATVSPRFLGLCLLILGAREVKVSKSLRDSLLNLLKTILLLLPIIVILTPRFRSPEVRHDVCDIGCLVGRKYS
jgi:hypothetical protein